MFQVLAPKTPACADVPKVKSLLVKYKEPSKPEDHSEADDVVLVQATTAGTTLNLIKRKAEELLDLEFPVKKIDFKKLTDENNLEDDEVCCVVFFHKQTFRYFTSLQLVLSAA